jgi:hypothetical protein
MRQATQKKGERKEKNKKKKKNKKKRKRTERKEKKKEEIKLDNNEFIAPDIISPKLSGLVKAKIHKKALFQFDY